MTKQEFLEKLNNLLSDIPKTERDSAIQYYEEYFEEAGIGEYGTIPEDMESPEAIAQDIRAGLGNEEQPREDYFQKEQNITKEKQPMDSSKIILPESVKLRCFISRISFYAIFKINHGFIKNRSYKFTSFIY